VANRPRCECSGDRCAKRPECFSILSLSIFTNFFFFFLFFDGHRSGSADDGGDRRGQENERKVFGSIPPSFSPFSPTVFYFLRREAWRNMVDRSESLRGDFSPFSPPLLLLTFWSRNSVIVGMHHPGRGARRTSVLSSFFSGFFPSSPFSQWFRSAAPRIQRGARCRGQFAPDHTSFCFFPFFSRPAWGISPECKGV